MATYVTLLNQFVKNVPKNGDALSEVLKYLFQIYFSCYNQFYITLCTQNTQ